MITSGINDPQRFLRTVFQNNRVANYFSIKVDVGFGVNGYIFEDYIGHKDFLLNICLEDIFYMGAIRLEPTSVVSKTWASKLSASN